MTKKVFTLDTQSGIQRDGTVFDANCYIDGRWVRFQRGRPRKIGGYRAIVQNAHGYSRGIYVNSVDGNNQVFNGYDDGLEVVNIDNDGIGSGINQFTFTGPLLTLNTLVGGSGYVNATYTAVPLTGGSGTGAQATVVVSGGAVTSVTITNIGNDYVVGNTLSASNTNLGGSGSGFSITVATITTFTANDLNLWQFDSSFDAQGSGDQLLIAHAGQNLAQIDAIALSPVLAGDISGLTLSPLVDSSGTAPTGDIIEVAGGVVVLHPYIFVYGDNGLIKNCVAGDPYDWNGADSNETNVASTKIVKGLPVRGGSNAPSGLFWALDSLIRVSYTPTTTTVGSTSSTFFWRYDIISSQSSILSSQSVIEYDGIYYWCGSDRFLLYNGVVKEIKNTFNQNYFFDNLNYAQRQKVYANKVPRFGEIWWYFPSGDSEECNDAVIYNVREDIWYDAGEALGANRSAGYFSQVFHYPINAGTTTIVVSSAAGILRNQAVTGTGIGVGAVVTVIAGTTITLSVVNSATVSGALSFAGLTLTLSLAATATAIETATFNTVAGLVTLWHHETGVDEVVATTSNAIESYFETSDLGWVQGGPPQTSPDDFQGDWSILCKICGCYIRPLPL